MTARAEFTQAQIRRAIQAVKKEGLPIAGVRPDGTVIIGESIAPQLQPVDSAGQPARAPQWWEDMEK